MQDYYTPKEVKKALEDHIIELNDKLDETTKLSKPVVEESNNQIHIKYEIESSSIKREMILDVLNIAKKEYGPDRHWEPVGLKEFAGMYELLTEQEIVEDENTSYERNTTIGVRYSPGCAMITTEGSSQKGPHIEIHLKTDGKIFENDLEFLQNIYEILLPEKTSTDHKAKFTELGLTVLDDLEEYDWNYLAGYDQLKETIKSKIIFPNLEKKLYTEIRNNTRNKPGQLTYNCFLFEGTYGVGKTDMARVVANNLNFSFIEIPLETVVSKWFGEAEKIIANIFESAWKMGNVVLFLDEIDTLVGDRDRGMHEVTNRITSTIMSKTAKTTMEDSTVVIAASNKPHLLDGALKRRFKKQIHFALPNENDLIHIYKHYAKQLNEEEIKRISLKSNNFSGYDVLKVCEDAEEMCFESLQKNPEKEKVPTIDHYIAALEKQEKNTIKVEKKPIGFGTTCDDKN